MILIYIYTNVVSVKGALAMAHIGRLMYIYIYIFACISYLRIFMCVYIYLYNSNLNSPKHSRPEHMV